MTDRFGTGLDRILLDLDRRLQKLEAGQRSGPGLTIGQASGPFLIPSASTPAAPPSGGYLYFSGGTLRQRTPGGDRPVGGQGAPVPDPDSIDAPILNSSATVVGSDYNTLRGDVFDLRSDLMDLISSLRGGDVIDT
jgi:hypothetical protein